ncbi:MAG: glycosyltransferase [Acidimicrobiia bacterium]
MNKQDGTGNVDAAEKCRVLRVIARMNVGGPAIAVIALTQGLSPQRFENRTLIGSVGEGEDDYLELKQIELDAEVIPGLGRNIQATGDLRALWALVKEIRAFRPRIIHTHTAKAGVLGRIAAMISGVRPRPKLVHSFHGHLLNGYFSPTKTRLVVWVERALAWKTDQINSEGANVRDALLAHRIGAPSKYRVIVPGLDVPPGSDREAARKEFGVADSDLVVAFVGRLTKIKRPDRLVDVARAVCARVPNARFLILGDGDLRAETETRAGDIADRMTFLGFRPDVGTILNASDLVLLTSDNEGMPYSLIEAGLCGVPVVSTDVGSVSEVVVDGVTGRVVPLEVSALADATSELLADPAVRIQLGNAARIRCHEQFSTAAMVARVAEGYEELMNPRGSISG